MKLRILYHTFDDLSRPGAWRTHVLATLRALAARGHDCCLVCPGDPGLSGPEPFAVVPFFRFRNRWLRVSLGALASFFTLFLEVVRRRPHFIYSRGIHLQPMPLLASFLSGARLVVEVNGFVEDELTCFVRRGLFLFLRDLHVAAGCRFVLVSEGGRRTFLQRTSSASENVFVAYNGVDEGLFRPRDRAACRRQLGLAERPFTFVMVSSFYPFHAHELVLGAFADAVREGDDLCLVLVGRGPTWERVCGRVDELGLRDRVVLPGLVEHEEVPLWVGAADVCLTAMDLPTDMEWSSIKTCEYLAAGRPVLLACSNLDTLRVYDGAGAAWTCPIRGDAATDRARLREGFTEMRQSAALRDRLGRTGREWVLRQFTWGDTARAIEDALRSILAGRSVSEPA